MRLIEMLSPSVQNLKTLPKQIWLERSFEALTHEINALAIKFSGMEQVAGHALLLLQDMNEKNIHSISGITRCFLPLITNIEILINKATNNINPSRARLSAFMIVNTALGFCGIIPFFIPIPISIP